MKRFRFFYIDEIIINALKRMGKDVSDISKIEPSKQECSARSQQEVIEFYGLDKPDVLWYRIEQLP